MGRPTTRVVLSRDDEHGLRGWLKKGMPKFLSERARMVLLAAEGRSTQEIARALRTRPARVSKWRTRFARLGLAGLHDAPRAGRPRVYGAAVVERILRLVEQPAPRGERAWTAELVAEALGDVSAAQVWRLLRQRGIWRGPARVWCIDTEPEFEARWVEMGGLFVRPAERALVVFAGEEPPPGGPAAVGGTFRVPERRLLRHFSRAIPGKERMSLHATLEAAANLVRERRFRSRRRRELGDFLYGLLAARPGRQVHVVLEGGRLEARSGYVDRFPGVEWHFVRSEEAWLDQVRCWLVATSRGGARRVRELIHGLDRLIAASVDPEAAAFEWMATK